MSRPLRMFASLVVVWGVYWLYSVLVVPLVEPQAAAHSRPKPAPVVPDAPAPNRQLDRLRPYFPQDARELDNPIVVETANFTLLIKDYRTVAERQVEIKPCTLVFFPDGAGTEEPSRVIIMRAPGGAVLDFDEDCDLSRLKVGRLLGGRLVGEVTIQGNIGRGAGPGDPSGELLVTTRDVQLTQQRIWTPHDVSFQLGNNRGSGSDMQILLATPAGKKTARGKNQNMPRGIESFQLMRDVKLTADLAGTGAWSARGTAPGAAPQSLEVRCQGAFRFDMVGYVATFENHVDVQRMNPAGPADSLSCELLAIHFARGAAGPDLTTVKKKSASPSLLRNTVRDQAANAAGVQLPNSPQSDPQPEGERDGVADLRRDNPFAVTTIEARGNPVVIHATTPQGEAEGRGEHLAYDVQTGGLMVEGDEPVSLRFGPQQIVSKLIRYTPAPDGQSAEALAEGAGRFSGSLPGDATRKIEATWTKQLALRPDQGRQLLSVLGSAKLNYAELGSLSGEEIWLWLIEDSTHHAPRDASPHAEREGYNHSRYRPHSLLCRGSVQIDSPQFAGRTEQLEAWFHPAADPSEAPARNEASGPANFLQPQSAANGTSTRYELNGRLTQVQFVLAGGRPALRDVSISGDVSLSELPAAGVGGQPLNLAGDTVQLLAADAADTTLTVTGKPAKIAGRGLGLSGGSIRYNKADGRIWIDGQGEMTLLIPGESGASAPGGFAAPGGFGDAHPLKSAAASAKPATPVTVQFARGLNFDGRTARFDGPVVVRSDERQLQTPQMMVRLSEPIDLTRPKSDRKPQLESIDCVGGVVMENRTLDANGNVTSIDRLQAGDLSIQQPSGDLKATGPGWASTIRVGAAVRSPLPGRAAAAPAVQNQAGKLSYVKIRFQHQISGNVNRRELTFADEIACIYGPVADWTSELQIPRAADLEAGQLLLTCDRITANDLGPAGGTPGSDQPNIELKAEGNARVDAREFAAEGEQMIYSAGKQLLTLEGAGQADAHLWQKGPGGEQTSHAAYHKILYWRATNRVQVDGIRSLDLNQLGRSK